MKIHIKLMSGDILDYIPRGVRGEKCKILTHKPHMERMILDHLDLNLNTYFVKLLTEEDQRELDEIYYEKTIRRKSEYYLDNDTIMAFVQSYKDHTDSFFESCEKLLTKSKELYYSLDNIKDLKTEKLENEKDLKKYIILSKYFDIKLELETAIWQLCNCLGIPIIIGDCDPQNNNNKKMSPNPTRTILYYTRSIDNCENKLNNL